MIKYCKNCEQDKACSAEIGYEDINWCDECIENMVDQGDIFQCDQCNKYWREDDRYDCSDILICNNCHEYNEECNSYQMDYYEDNDDGDDVLHD